MTIFFIFDEVVVVVLSSGDALNFGVSTLEELRLRKAIKANMRKAGYPLHDPGTLTSGKENLESFSRPALCVTKEGKKHSHSAVDIIDYTVFLGLINSKIQICLKNPMNKLFPMFGMFCNFHHFSHLKKRADYEAVSLKDLGERCPSLVNLHSCSI